MCWEERNVYLEVRMTIICEQNLNPRMTNKSEQSIMPKKACCMEWKRSLFAKT
jgi:hypothetical protein